MRNCKNIQKIPTVNEEYLQENIQKKQFKVSQNTRRSICQKKY